VSPAANSWAARSEGGEIDGWHSRNCEKNEPRGGLRILAVIAGELREVLERVEIRLSRAQRALELLDASRGRAKLDALEDVVVHGRAVTNVVENCRHLLPGFDVWYDAHAAALAADPGFRRFYQMRSEILKRGQLSVRRAAIIFDALSGIPEPPEGAVAFDAWDEETGKCAWLVKLADGREEKILFDQPASVQIHEFLGFEPSLGTMEDIEAERTAERYVSYLRRMVDELRVLIDRMT
jgi:hypothetical protein